jgi:hypothetical protein
VAFFMGRALWMVSVSVNGWPREIWTPEVERIAMRVIDRVLEGCGMPGDDRVEQGRLTVLVRRQCNPAERARVREPYLVQP